MTWARREVLVQLTSELSFLIVEFLRHLDQRRAPHYLLAASYSFIAAVWVWQGTPVHVGQRLGCVCSDLVCQLSEGISWEFV